MADWVKALCSENGREVWRENFSVSKIVLIVLLQLLNFSFFIYGAVIWPSISSYLLYIFVANLMVYTSYYITMKIYHKEKIMGATYVYIVLAVGFWIPGERGQHLIYCSNSLDLCIREREGGRGDLNNFVLGKKMIMW